MHKVVAALVTALTIAAPAYADLRYTARVESRAIPTTGTPNPITGLVGAMLLQRMPVGIATTTIGEGGIRVEFAEATGLFEAGHVVLLGAGTMTVLNPQEMTYWTVPAETVAIGAALTPEIMSMRTGEADTIAGLRAERTTFTFTIDLPLPAGMQLPPDIPRSIAMDGEMWVADRFQQYAALMRAAGGAAVSSLGLGALPQDGFVVRQITRNPQLGYEIEFNVLEFEEIPPSPALFAVPDGFREVPMPRAGDGIPR
jgi:hypothetical protein